MSLPDQPQSPLHDASVALNEMFLTMVASGFKEEQALRLIAYLIEDMTFEGSKD